MKDQALPRFLQDIFVQKSGMEWLIKDIDASHTPFASKPEELVEIAAQSAAKFSE